MTDVFKAAMEQRTEAGALLRSAFDGVTLREGEHGRVVFVADGSSGAALGVAARVGDRWVLSGSLKVAVRDGRARNPVVEVGLSW